MLGDKFRIGHNRGMQLEIKERWFFSYQMQIEDYVDSMLQLLTEVFLKQNKPWGNGLLTLPSI